MATFWASIFVFGILIFFHELGHFAVAKAVGIKVHEFSLGFGPKLVGVARGETNYNLRLFPLGGFVRMAGMDPEEEEVEKGTGFGDKTVLQRVSVIVAGPIMNFFLAILLLALIFMFQGYPAPNTTIKSILPGQPAEIAGIKAGDRIDMINDKKMNTWDDITASINSHAGEKISVLVIREQKPVEITVVPEAGEGGRGLIGIMPEQEMKRLNPLAAIATGFSFTVKVTVLILSFIGKMITGQAPADLGGPVRVIWEIDQAVQTGIFYLLQLAAFLSINLGLFNLLPIPALDGSRIMFLGFEGLRGRPVDPAKENFIHLVGFGFLLLLIVFITYNDILQLFIQNPQAP
ncbi:regulator of sigma E protease [Desulfotomaculum arcticum]|uniref:Zinc metalloprotease n=1 Tax=Desulfotruncus arcticus DSM 17038 TaxID=1121424 RepID=A0A1I2SDM3_9FIRM|nr:RIP metalloprotease RseP [Desulfotruncus arcticus]SFG49819.1 regulator of sigma E protease [Desulfotomaculum arcticum] [Desulfotruncus arcticus DSM 17038]